MANGNQPSPATVADESPFCGACGYVLTGLTESSKCPECGRPIVEVLRWPGKANPSSGRRYRSSVRVWGMPLVHVAMGPGPEGALGKARGFIAIGDEARGVIAIGGQATGVVALGGGAIGVFAFGGGAAGLISAIGGGAIAGGLAIGGGAGALGTAAGGGAFAFGASLMAARSTSALGIPPAEAVMWAGAIAAGLLIGTLGTCGAAVLMALHGRGRMSEAERLRTGRDQG